MGVGIVVNIVNIIVGFLLIVLFLGKFSTADTDYMIMRFAAITACLWIMLAEITLPKPFDTWFPFFKTWIGTGLYIVFCSLWVLGIQIICSTLVPIYWTTIIGLLVAAIGVVWIIIGVVSIFAKKITRPAPLMPHGKFGLDQCPCSLPSFADRIPGIAVNIFFILAAIFLFLQRVCKAKIYFGCMGFFGHVPAMVVAVFMILREVYWPPKMNDILGVFNTYAGEAYVLILVGALRTTCWASIILFVFAVFTIVIACLGGSAKPLPIFGGVIGPRKPTPIACSPVAAAAPAGAVDPSAKAQPVVVQDTKVLDASEMSSPV